MSETARPRLLIIDGHSMAFRAFFALPVDNFATSTGQHTNAVYGFTSMLINLIRDEKPTHVAVAFDAGHHTFRTDSYPEYKAGRASTPEEFKDQVPLIQQVLEAARIHHFQLDGWEADDILATWTDQGLKAGMEVLICSGDRDALQLVTDSSLVLYPLKGVSTLARMDAQAIEEKYGVGPDRYSDLAALVGESSDNIPGVPKVGPKTAAKWITTYGDLSGVLEHASEIKGVAGQNLRDHAEQVARNRELNQLRDDVEVPIPASDLQLHPYDRQSVEKLFDVLEFRTLRDRLYAAWPVAGAAEPAAAAATEMNIIRHDLAEWLNNHPGQIGVQVSGRHTGNAYQLDSLLLSDGSEDAFAIDAAHMGPQMESDLRVLLAEERELVIHDAKSAAHLLASAGFELGPVRVDTAIAAYLLHPDARGYDVDPLIEQYTDRLLPAEAAPDELDLEGVGAFTLDAARSSALIPLASRLRELLTQRDNIDLFENLELPVARLLFAMEQTGIAVDADFLHDLASTFDGQVTEAANSAFETIGREVNLSSPKQLQAVLFDELDLPKTRKTKTGYTTDAEALTDLYLKSEHPFLQFLLQHRDAIKLRQTVEGLIKTVADDGRIHTTYSQTQAATGRLSSADPNLQNIPIRTPAGQRIREAFIAGEGFESLMTADYSQIEMRIMAHLSEDEGLIRAFESGEDLHSYVGSRVFEVEPSEVSASMRSKIKAMSYGLAYGLSAFGLSRQLGISGGEAGRLMEDYFSRFGGVQRYLSGVVEDARGLGFTETIMGRRRYLPDLNSDSRQRREMAQRMALNAPIQGSAADIIKVAMLNVARDLRSSDLKSRLLLQVHDELVLEVAPGERQALEELVRAGMANAAELSVPLDVSVGVGRSWRHAAH